MSHKFSVKILIYLLLLFCGLWASYLFNVAQDEENVLGQTKTNLEKFNSYIQTEFTRYQAIQTQLSLSNLVQSGLQQATAINSNELDRYLQDIQISSGASDVYLLDLSGTVIASSNWYLPHSYKAAILPFAPIFTKQSRAMSMSLLRSVYVPKPVVSILLSLSIKTARLWAWW